MVKELTMDNSIFAIGAQSADTKVSAGSDLSTENFENVFETAKKDSNYTDKTDLKQTNDKVIKVAEKSVKKGDSSRNTATDVTKVTKKVSNNLTKSPKTATHTHNEATCDNASQTSGAKETEAVLSNDARTFSVKAEIQSSDAVDTVKKCLSIFSNFI